MLVLKRKVDQTVVIGDGIRVKVLEIRGGSVRLGFTADKTVPINREEVQQRIDEVREFRTLIAPDHREEVTHD